MGKNIRHKLIYNSEPRPLRKNCQLKNNTNDLFVELSKEKAKQV